MILLSIAFSFFFGCNVKFGTYSEHFDYTKNYYEPLTIFLMDNYKQKISFLKGTFNSRFLELRYRQSSFKNELEVNRLAFFLIAVTSILFIQNDAAILGNSPEFIHFIKLRALFSIFCIACILLISRLKRFYQYDLLLAAWLTGLVSILVYVDLARPASYSAYVVIDILVIVSIYVLFVFGLWGQTLIALGFTLACLGLMYGYKDFPVYSRLTILMGFILSNVLGFSLAVRLHYLRRIDFVRSRALSYQAQKMSRIALKDPLTGLLNRRSYDDQSMGLFDNFKRYAHSFALIVIDIDFFKHVNDTYGHLAGDKVLKEFAMLLKLSARPGDQVFRYGGEEFAMLLNNSSLDQAEAVAERVREKLRATHLLNDFPELKVSASFGVADALTEDLNARSIFHRADKALYIAKQSGRDQVVIAAEGD